MAAQYSNGNSKLQTFSLYLHSATQKLEDESRNLSAGIIQFLKN